jgi:hypothetical protein
MKTITDRAMAFLTGALILSVASVNADEAVKIEGKVSVAPPAAGAIAPMRPQLRMDWNFKGADVTEILKSAADAGGFKLVILGDVSMRLSLFMRDLAPQEAIQQICASAGLNCLLLTQTNTFVIGPPAVKLMPSQAPVPRPQNRFNVFSPSDSLQQPGPNWRRFDFNGVTYYQVPLR